MRRAYKAAPLPAEAVAAALKKRLAELARARQALTEQVKAIDADIRTLEIAGRILDGHRTGVRPAKPKVTEHGAMPALKYGVFTRAVLEALRDADHPLTAMETGHAALARLGLAVDVMSKDALTTKVTTTTRTHLSKGTLRRIDRDGEPFRLEVAR